MRITDTECGKMSPRIQVVLHHRDGGQERETEEGQVGSSRLCLRYGGTYAHEQRK